MTRRSFAAALLLAVTAACSRGPTATEGNVIGAWRSDAQNVGTVTLPTGPASATTFEMRHYRPNGSYLRTVYITGVTMNRSWVAAAEEGTWSLRDGALVTTTVNAFYAPDPAHAQDSPTLAPVDAVAVGFRFWFDDADLLVATCPVGAYCVGGPVRLHPSISID